MKKLTCLLALMTSTAATPVFAGYTLTNLALFSGGAPTGQMTLSGSTLYVPGSLNNNGAIYAVPVTGGSTGVVTTFDGSNGGLPNGNLFVSGGTIYGTSTYGGSGGGAFGSGVAFSVPVSGGTPTVLTNFVSDAPPAGGDPNTGVILVGSTLYGTTGLYGPNNRGEVFSLPATGGTPTAIGAFNGTTNGQDPDDLILSGNTLYGTNIDSVWSLPLTGGTPTVLATLNSDPNSLVLSGSTLYGTAYNVATGAAQIFSLPTTGGAPTILATLSNSPYAISPIGFPSLSISGNTIYGVNPSGGDYNDGYAFSLPTTGGTPTVMSNFYASSGIWTPSSGLIASGSTFYGALELTGPSAAGTAFSLTSSASIITASSTAPTTFGSQLGTLTLTSGASTAAAKLSFSPTSKGYVLTSAGDPNGTTEYYALKISDSVSGNLSSDLAALAIQINEGGYDGLTDVDASLTDPTKGSLSGIDPGLNLFLTITDPGLGANPYYFGFDLTQFDANSDSLTASEIAVIPEPATLGILGFVSIMGLSRRRAKA